MCLTYASVVQCSLDCKLSIDFVVPFCLTLFHISTHLWTLILFFCLTHTGKAFAYYLFTPSKRFFSCLQFAGVYVSATVEHISCHGARYLKIGNKFILMPFLSVFIYLENYFCFEIEISFDWEMIKKIITLIKALCLSRNIVLNTVYIWLLL